MTRFFSGLFLAANLWAQLPEGPGRAELEKLCKNCHELARAVSRRQDRDGWQVTLHKMVALGTKGTDQEFALILDYLAKNPMVFCGNNPGGWQIFVSLYYRG